jgi:hypothetical protein
MNRNWTKLKEMCDFCCNKCDSIAKKHPWSYVFGRWTKAGREWSYYMAIWERTILDMTSDINDNEIKLLLMRAMYERQADEVYRSL